MKKKVLITSMGGYGSLSVENGLSYKNRKKKSFLARIMMQTYLRELKKYVKKSF